MDQDQVQVVVPMKMCSFCKVQKPADTENFPKNKSSRDGLGHWCKSCHTVYRAKKAGKAAAI